MKIKILTILLICILILPVAFAKIGVFAPESYPQPTTFNIGQDQSYSVIFDGEGEATVAAKLVINNIQETSLKELKLEIPGNDIRIIAIVQEYYYLKKTCSRYGEICVDESCRYDYNKCIEYTEYPYGNPLYYLIDYTKEELSKSTIYTLELPQKVKSQQSANVILYYKTEGYTTKNLGKFNFDFETIKNEYDTNSVRVSISVNEDLYLKGVKSQIDYRSNFLAAEGSFNKLSGTEESADLQRFSSQIGYYGGITKTAQGLDPWESFHVKGTYAKSKFALYAVNTFLIILGIIFVLWLFYFFVVRRLIRMKTKNRTLKVIGGGVGGAVGVIILWFIAWFLIRILGKYNSMILLPIILLFGILIFIMFLGPSVYIGIKEGVGAGIWTLVITAISLLILSIIIIVLLGILNSPQIMPMMGVAETFD